MIRHKVKNITYKSKTLYVVIFLITVLTTLSLNFVVSTSNSLTSLNDYDISQTNTSLVSYSQYELTNTNLYASTGTDPCLSGNTRIDEIKCSILLGGNANDLPAWRWTNMELDADTSGMLGFFQQIPVSIATVFLMLAQFAWNLLLGLTKIALEPTTLLSPAAPAINTVLSEVAERLTAFAILFWVIVFIKIVNNMSKGKVKEAFTSFVIFALLFAGVGVVLSSSSNAVKLPDDQQIYAKGTLPWLAATVAGAASGLTGEAALATDTFKSQFTTTDDQGSTPTCRQYNDAIYLGYNKGSGNKSLITLSKLWEQTQYKAWTAALFGTKVGSVDLGGRVMCHWAESVNRVPAVKQQKVAIVAYGSAFGDINSVTETFPIFGPYSSDDRRRAMVAWAACELNNGTWQTAPYFKGVWRDSLDADTLEARGNNAHKCTYPFTDGDILQPEAVTSSSGDDFYIFGGRSEEAYSQLTGQNREALAPFETFTSSFTGLNTADRLIQSMLALLISMFFLYALGFLSVGMIAAQLMLIILIMLFPVTIALFAIGSSKAKPMLKLTGTTAVAQAIFTLILLTLLILASLFQDLLSILAPEGFLRSLMVGLAPVAAFFVVHKILKTIGMGNILSPTGAMSFLASSALVATGDSRLAKHGLSGADGKNSMQRGLRKGASAGIAAGSMTAASALAAGKLTSRGLHKGAGKLLNSKDMFTKEGRAVRKENKQAEASRRRMARMSKDKLTRFDKLANWADSKQLSNGVMDRTLGSVARSAGLLAAGAGGLAGLAGVSAWGGAKKLGNKGYNSLSPEVRGSLIKARGRIGRHLGEGWADQNEKYDPNSSPLIPISDREFMDSEEVTSLKTMEDAILAKAIEKDPHGAENLQIDSAGNLIKAAGTALVGEFSSQIETTHDLAAIKHSAAVKRGVDVRNLVVSSNGAVVPKAWVFDKDALRQLPFEETMDPMYWLPMEDKIQLEGETPDQYASRMISICYERGVMSSSGAVVNAYSLAGYDTNKESDRAEIEAWLAGGENKVLDNFTITSKDSAKEQRRIDAARKSIERTNAKRERIVQETQIQAYSDLLDAPDVLPDQVIKLDQMTQSLTGKLASQKETALAIESIMSELKNKEIELSASSGRGKEDVENQIFRLRQEYEKLENQRKEQGNALDRSFAELKDTLFEHANTTIRTKTDIGVANESIKNEDELYEEMIKGFEYFQNLWEAIEENTNQAWLGNTKAIEELIQTVDTVNKLTSEETEAIIKKVKSLIEEAEQGSAQIEAVRKVRTGARTPTAKELAEIWGSKTDSFI